jgi:hypothetical protein
MSKQNGKLYLMNHTSQALTLEAKLKHHPITGTSVGNWGEVKSSFWSELHSDKK